MSNYSQEYFSGPQLLGLRREIEEHGFITDEFLPGDPDCPVFGINLACAYPFPTSAEAPYTNMAARLAKLDTGVYVYPLWQTHITIMTFVNFSRHKRPSPGQTGELRSLTSPIIGLLKSILDSEKFGPFQIHFRPPVLSRKAAILPVANPSGEIPRIRQRAGQLLEVNKELRERLARVGLNVPGIMHSTIMRFTQPPRDIPHFTAGFDAVAAAATPFAITVRELLLTAETKPYMRGGDIMHRFALAL